MGSVFLEANRGMRVLLAATVIFLVTLSYSVPLLAPVQALEDGRIGVLHIGCIARSRPFWQMRSDRLFRMRFVQATLRDWAAWGPSQVAKSEADVYRMIRLYMPRTYQDLVASYDVIVLSQANVLAVGPHIDKLARGVSEGGLGLFMGGGWESFGGSAGHPAWGETSIGKLLPTEDIVGMFDESDVQRVVIDKPGHELMSSLPWDMRDPAVAFPWIWHHNPVTLKQGAEQLAHAIPGSGRKDPLMVTWQVEGEARVFALTSEVHRLLWYPDPRAWRYAIDFGCNLMIYLDKRPVPQDVELVHAARAKMFEVETKRSLLLALLDFCESFGASTRSIMPRFQEIDSVIAEALPQYLQLKFEDMLESYRVADGMLAKAEEEAVRLKNRTLLWVYVIEWLAVTGTAMVCGFLLWSLMVRRRLYREVGVTKAGGLNGRSPLTRVRPPRMLGRCRVLPHPLPGAKHGVNVLSCPFGGIANVVHRRKGETTRRCERPAGRGHDHLYALLSSSFDGDAA